MADYTQATPRAPAVYSPEKAHKTEQIFKGFQQARTRRYNHEGQWQESSLLAWPEYANTFFFGYDQMPGQKKAQQQIDSSVSVASHRFASIVGELMTPGAMMWSKYQHPDKYVMKQRGVKQYYQDLSEKVWIERYKPSANFIGQNLQNMQSLGVLGNMNMYVDELDPATSLGKRGLRYIHIPVGHLYYVENSQGQIIGYYRTFRWTAQQFHQRWPDTFPDAMRPALEAQSGTLFWGLQYVCMRDDYMPWRIDAKGKPWASYYLSFTGQCILEEEGIRKFPLSVGRYMQAPDEIYGRGPMQIALAAAKTKNAMKVVFLKQGHRAGDPIYLTVDDAMLDPEFHPGAVNKGGMSADGQRLIDILPTGNIQITEKMMEAEGEIIDDVFLVAMFRLALKMENSPQMNARQVVELIEQRGMFLAPTVGRQQAEYLGGMMPRELDVLDYNRLLPPMPDVLKEAGVTLDDTSIEFDNPLTRAMKAGRVGNLMKGIELTAQIAQTSHDDSVWDYWALDRVVTGMNDDLGVAAEYAATPQELQAKKKNRAQMAAEEAKTKQMPAQAAIIKAQAISEKAKAGQNIGGTLSGVPQGQMPGVPGSQPGVQGQPGIGGRPGMQGFPGA